VKTKNKYSGNIEQEKLRLRIKQLELEKQIREDWKDIKSGFSIPHLFSRTNEKSLFSEAVNYGLDYVITKAYNRAGEKIEISIRKGIEKLKTVFRQNNLF
jgi:hypothetical protein